MCCFFKKDGKLSGNYKHLIHGDLLFMFKRLARKLWGEFESHQEWLKFVRLASIFSFTIGVYWIINPTKEVVFFHTVGCDYFPYAKIFSILCLIPTIMLYGKLVDRFRRDRVFYIVTAFFALMAFVFGYRATYWSIQIRKPGLH